MTSKKGAALSSVSFFKCPTVSLSYVNADHSIPIFGSIDLIVKIEITSEAIDRDGEIRANENLVREI